MGAAAHADLRDDAGRQQQQQRLWRSSSDMPDANLAEEGFHDGFHQRGSGGNGGGGGGGADVRHDVLGGAGFSGGSGAGGSRKPVRRPSHGTLLRRVQHTNGHKHGQGDSVLTEFWNLVLLTTLYAMQGVPLGLTMGSMPFLLQARASYTAIGIFSLAAYPYSFKLAWSPVVDSVYSLALGRRKSWIVPIQATSGVALLLCANWADARLQAADVVAITTLFFGLVLLAATQDIAVDGWALTLLSRRHVGWASTCQTVGMNAGYFTSFTVFLALNDASFCNAWLRSADDVSPVGILSLATYLRFWGWTYLAVTLAVAALKHEVNFRAPAGSDSEDEGEPEKELGLREAYLQLLRVIRLPAVRRLAAVLLTMRLAVLPAEAAAPLKLLEKGVSKEALAGLVLLEFPCELFSAVLAGRWAAGATPFGPWMRGYWLRLLTAAAATTLVWRFPSDVTQLADSPGDFAALAAVGLTTSFTSTLMFTALGSFFNKVSDPDMGGAYLTLLNTIANMGVTLPKLAIFAVMDLLSDRTCVGAMDKVPDSACPANHAAATAADNACVIAGGKCHLQRDGYYGLSFAAIGIGAALGLWYRVALPRLQALPADAWRAKTAARKSN